jgi:hypothetical protein
LLRLTNCFNFSTIEPLVLVQVAFHHTGERFS